MSVSAISTMSWSLDDDLAFYAAEGIDGVGVSLRKLEDAAGGVAGAARRVAAAGLRVTNLIGLGPFRLTDPGEWPKHRDRLFAAVDAAGTVGAGCLVVTTGPAGQLTWEDAADRLAEAIGPVLGAARHAGVTVALEHTNSLRADIGFVHTLRDALDLAARLDIGVCMEINACWAERHLGDTIGSGVAAGRIALVQVSDYVIGTLTTPDRAVPGDGDIPIRRILDQVLAAGYTGAFDLELIGPRIEAEGYPSAVRRSVAALGDLLTALGA
ncbi:MAG: xylose isomerase-like enzyme [Acidimicrobiales bacterium]|nr:xylose isomerase-like enzyme [Acidimicrobiales bacterium]